ncbi:hypothetical protein HaLaN_03047 [Haematococcus lacustris]|uniref:Uncharacterized protein n=1 Tax=Haematococcus lacustris TaxID=44745 RepID=A0A699YYH4_HAELA|nr:hypothetical protein HaLaN_03047 [Haematococcus lacustris]
MEALVRDKGVDKSAPAPNPILTSTSRAAAAGQQGRVHGPSAQSTSNCHEALESMPFGSYEGGQAALTVDGESTIITVTGAHHSHKLVLTKTWAAELRLTKLSLASAIFNTSLWEVEAGLTQWQHPDGTLVANGREWRPAWHRLHQAPCGIK